MKNMKKCQEEKAERHWKEMDRIIKTAWRTHARNDETTRRKDWNSNETSGERFGNSHTKNRWPGQIAGKDHSKGLNTAEVK